MRTFILIMDIVKLGTIAAIMAAVVNCLNGESGDMCKDDQIKYMCHPTNPAKFTRCVANILNVFDCPPGLLFNVDVQTCDWPAKSGCGSINAIAAGGAPSEDKPIAPVEKKEPPNAPARMAPIAPGRKAPSAPGRKAPNAPGRMAPSAAGEMSHRPPGRMRDPQGPFENPFLTDAPPPSFSFNTQDNSVKGRSTSSPTNKRRMRKKKGRRRKKIRKTSKKPMFTRSRPIGTSPAPKQPQRPIGQKRGGTCDPLTCKLPHCRCPGSDIPGDLPVSDVPMMVMLTFDDRVNPDFVKLYKKLLINKRRNPNGCPIRGTFFVSGDGTNYQSASELHSKGHEIASHSLTHRFPTTWWGDAGYDGYVEEIEGMRQKLSSDANIPLRDITGMRVPFLQLGGNAQYEVLRDFQFTYDSSMLTGELTKTEQPPIWPFTLDYPPTQLHCKLPPCPTESFPGLWEVPLQRWYDLNGNSCSMPDSCTFAGSKQNTVKFLFENFNRHFLTNRAPLGIFIHATWFERADYHYVALDRFIRLLLKIKDVWIIPVAQSLEWTRHPTPISELDKLEKWTC